MTKYNSRWLKIKEAINQNVWAGSLCRQVLRGHGSQKTQMKYMLAVPRCMDHHAMFYVSMEKHDCVLSGINSKDEVNATA